MNNKLIIKTSIITTVVTVCVMTALAAILLYSNTVAGQNAQTETPSVSAGLLPQDALVVNAVERANPAVISIVVTKDVPIIEQYYGSDPFIDDLFGGDPFFQIPLFRERGTQQQEVGGGSAFLVSRDGLAVTNKHVVSDTNASYTAFTNDGRKFDVQVIARDPSLDIAVIKLSGGNFASLTFANSDELKIGQTAIAIGNSLGEFRNTVSVGVISGLARSVLAGDPSGRNIEQLEEVLQTDAAINLGNSGGPLLDLRGNVIGMNTAVAAGSENIGFAIPSNTIKGVVDSVRQHGSIIRAYIGVRYVTVNAALRERNNLSVDYGVLVTRGSRPGDVAVAPNSPAAKAGIAEGDIILSIDGVRLEGGKSLASVIRSKKVGDVIELQILRGSETRTVEVTLEQAPN